MKPNVYYQKIKLFLQREMGALIALLVLCIVMTIGSPYFLSLSNMMNILRQSSLIGIVAAGMTMILITGGIDLSVGSILSFASCVGTGMIVYYGFNVWASVFGGLMFGSLLGYINGILIAKVKLRPFIVTFAMMGILRGLTFISMDEAQINKLPEKFKIIGNGMIGFIPVPVIIMVVIYVFAYFFLYKTNIGRFIYAIGDNEEAALFSGIKVSKYKIIVYTLTGFLSALAGLILAARLDVASAVAGDGFELDVIAAVFIGGTSFKGGRGKLFGSFIGAMIMGIVKNGLNLFLVSSHWQRVILGIIIIVAVSIDVLRRKNKSEGNSKVGVYYER